MNKASHSELPPRSWTSNLWGVFLCEPRAGKELPPWGIATVNDASRSGEASQATSDAHTHPRALTCRSARTMTSMPSSTAPTTGGTKPSADALHFALVLRGSLPHRSVSRPITLEGARLDSCRLGVARMSGERGTQARLQGHASPLPTCTKHSCATSPTAPCGRRRGFGSRWIASVSLLRQRYLPIGLAHLTPEIGQ